MPLTMEKGYYTKLALALFLLATSIAIVAISVDYVDSLPSTPIAPDLIFQIIPFAYIYSVIAEVALLLSSAIFIFYLTKNSKWHELPLYLIMAAIFNILRAAIIPLNPFQNPYPLETFGILNWIIPQAGMFPSGHVGLAFFFFLLAEKKHAVIKYLLLALSLIIAFFMVASRGHYTVDVIGGLLLAFAIYILVSRIKARKKE